MDTNKKDEKLIPLEFWELPVYKAAVDLEKQFSASTKNTPRILKYGKIDEIHGEIIDLLVKISFSHVLVQDRIKFIEESLDLMRKVKIQIRILFDIRALSAKGFGALVLCEENVSRQLSGWLNSEKRKQNTNP